MEKEFDYSERPYFQFRDPSPDSQINAFGCENNVNPLCRGMVDAPDLLRKSMERFLIGNVV